MLKEGTMAGKEQDFATDPIHNGKMLEDVMSAELFTPIALMRFLHSEPQGLSGEPISRSLVPD